MSGNENYIINDVKKKITLISENIRTLNDMIKAIDEKLNQLNANNKASKRRRRLRTYLKAVAWVVRGAVMKQNKRNIVKC